MDFAKFVKIREEKFGAVIFDTLREKVYITNQTGKEILRLLQEGKSKQEIIQILSESYEYDPLQLQQEVIDFISELEEKNILV